MLSHTRARRELVWRTGSLLRQSVLRITWFVSTSECRRYVGGALRFPLKRGASHRCRASSAQLRARSLSPRAGARRAKLGTPVFPRVNRSPPRGRSWLPRKTNGPRPMRSRWERRGVSSEGAAAASVAARRRGAASRKATLQARAPEEDTPRRSRAMDSRKHAKRCRTDLTGACRAIGSIPYGANAYVLLDRPPNREELSISRARHTNMHS